MPPAARTKLDRIIDDTIELQIQSSEGDLMHQVRLRSYLAFLMNELDTAYQAPTQAEYATYDQLRAQTESTIAQLRSVIASR
jgi:hypothetical protein